MARCRALVVLLAIGAAVASCGGDGGEGSRAERRPARTSTTSTSTSTSSSTSTPTTTTTTVKRAGPTPTAPTASAPPTAPSFGLAGKTIAIDAGHNGGNAAHASEIARPIFIGTQTRACDTTGTQTNDGYPEHAYTLDVALRLQAILAAAGANVVMSRTTDTGVGPCIDERAYFGNRAHAHAAVSIHADGGPATGRGFHVNMPANIPGYTDDIYASSHALGVALRDAYAAGSGMPPSSYIGSAGLVERRDFGGLNLSDVPKVLFETGNMRNATDAGLLESADFRQRAAQSIAVGLAHYLSG